MEMELSRCKIGICQNHQEYTLEERHLNGCQIPATTKLNNPVPVSLLSGDRKPQIRFLGNHPSGSGNLYHKSFRM